MPFDTRADSFTQFRGICQLNMRGSAGLRRALDYVARFKRWAYAGIGVCSSPLNLLVAQNARPKREAAKRMMDGGFGLGDLRVAEIQRAAHCSGLTVGEELVPDNVKAGHRAVGGSR